MSKIYCMGFANFLAAVLCLFLCSCVFDTDEIYRSPANQNVTPPDITTINLDFNQQDTIFVYSTEVMNFSFSSSNQAIESVSLTINNGSPNIVTSSSGKFSFSNYYLSEGKYEVRLNVNTKTGSGSIAEQMGAERFVSSHKWILVSLPVNTKITRVRENGFQKISWKSCRSNRLIEYVIYCDYKAIGSVKTNYFIDSTYVGDEREYEVKVRLKDQETLEWGRLQLFDNEMPVPGFTATKENVYRVHWSKPIYYNAIDTVKVFIGSNINATDHCIKTTTNLNDTTVLVDPVYFGKGLNFTFQFIPKINRFKEDFSFYERYKVSESFVMGYPFAPKINWMYPIDKNNCLVDASDKIMTYSFSEDKFTAQYQDGYNEDWIAVSPGGTFVAGARAEEGDYFYAAANEMQDLFFVKIPERRFAVYSNLKAVADNGLGLFLDGNYDLKLFDLKTSQLIKAFTNEELYAYIKIKLSSRGDYFMYSKNNLYIHQITNDQVKLVQQNNEHRFYDFVSNNPDQYVTWNGSELFIKQLPDHSIVRKLTIADQYICNIDFYNNEILSFSDGHLYVRSFTDGHIIYDLKNQFHWEFNDDYAYLQNHVIFYKRNGVAYYLNQQ